MFGYIRPYKAEMLVREYEQYKSIYCRLCREMGKEYGIMSRLTLSYDCTFYTVLILALKSEEFSAESRACVINPLKKCKYCTCGSEVWKKAAALSVILTYQKLLDDISDSGFLKGLLSRFLLVFASSWRKKAKKRYPELDSLAEKMTEKQKNSEKDEKISLDKCAEATAEFLSKLFSGDFSDNRSRLLSEMGYHIGRWVYFMDAADDIEKDIKEAQFNPFVKAWKLTPEEYEKNKKEINIKCNEVLNLSLSQAVYAMQLLDFCSLGAIVENIVAKGLPEMQKEILFMEKKKVRRNVRSV